MTFIPLKKLNLSSRAQAVHLQKDRKIEYIIHRLDTIYFFLQILKSLENSFEAVVLHLITWHIYKKSYLNTSQNSTSLVRCFVPVNSMVCTEYSKQDFVFKLLKRAKHAE